MIPVLFDKKATSFNTNGIGQLSEALTCIVHEIRNGLYELTLTYPCSGKLFKQITEDCIIYAKPNEKSNPQPFRIYSVSAPMDGIVTYNAEHKSYDLSGNPIKPTEISLSTAEAAIDTILKNAVLSHRYKAHSDIATMKTASYKCMSARAALGGTEGSVIDTWGGELEFDNNDIYLHKNRGTDTGYIVKYGINIIDITQEKNIAETYTGIYPYAKYYPETESIEDREEVTVTLPEHILLSKYADNYGKQNILILDMTDQFTEDEQVTESALRNKAIDYVNSSGFDVPKISMTITPAALGQTPEYKQFKKLTAIGLCDTVTVSFEKLGIETKAKLVEYYFNVLSEKYESLVLGDASPNFADTINQTIADISKNKQELHNQAVNSRRNLENAIKNATEKITGQSGGYVVLNPPENPQEILIMDTPDINTAVNIWRWNSGGLGHSSKGYDGPYDTAITMDGQIVADYITAGTFDGGLIKADSITANQLSIAYQNEIKAQFEAKLGRDENNKIISMINAAADVIKLTSNRFVVQSDKLNITADGTVTAKGGNFIAGTDSNNANLSNSTLNFVKNNSKIAGFGTTKWEGTSSYGTAVNSEPKSKFISFGNKQSSSDSNYTTVFLLNYGLNPDGITQDIILSGTSLIEDDMTIKDGKYIKFPGSAGTATLRSAYFTWDGTTGRAIQVDGSLYTTSHLHSNSTLSCNGTKNRIVDTANYGKRKLYAYETTSPMFADFGHSKIGEDGTVKIELDEIFAECVEVDLESYINITSYTADAGLYIAEKGEDYFIVAGIVGAEFDWQITYRQKDYRTDRLEPFTEPEVVAQATASKVLLAGTNKFEE